MVGTPIAEKFTIHPHGKSCDTNRISLCKKFRFFCITLVWRNDTLAVIEFFYLLIDVF